jgi:hypothetical protein
VVPDQLAQLMELLGSHLLLDHIVLLRVVSVAGLGMLEQLMEVLAVLQQVET